jgi:hypothetical protein
VRRLAKTSGGSQSPVALVKAMTAEKELDPYCTAADLALKDCGAS